MKIKTLADWYRMLEENGSPLEVQLSQPDFHHLVSLFRTSEIEYCDTQEWLQDGRTRVYCERSVKPLDLSMESIFDKN